MKLTLLHRSSRASHLLLAGFALAAVNACSDIPLLPPEVTKSNAIIGSGHSVEQAALDELTRAVAMALANPGLRNQLRSDLRASRHTTEHKLELRSHLKGESGGLLLAQMAYASDLTRDSLLALVNAVRPLEFYMPVAAHRENWSGGGDLLVASQLAEKDTPTGYDLSGQPVTLSLKEAPSMPTLSLVPIETNFATSLDGKRYKNAHDKGGTAIGTFMVVDPCTDPTAPGCDGGTTPPPGVTPDAVYLTESHLVDAHEPWPKGAPELELHVHGPQSKDYPRYGEDLTCAGGDSPGLQFYDQNGNDWSASIGSGAPLLMSRYNIDQFQARFPREAVHYIMWEDDYQACKTVTDRDMNAVLLQAAGSAVGAGLVAMRIGASGGATIGAAIAAAAVSFTVDLIKNGASLVYGNDDLVGALIDIRGTPDEANHPGQTHLVKDGDTFNGTARVEFVWATPANGRPYAASLTPSATSAGIDQVQAQTLTAAVSDQYGSSMSGHPISWRSDNSSIARIDDDGILHGAGAGNTTVYVRACDPDCMDRPVSVAVTGPTVSGPGYVYDGNATLSASVINPRQGSYYYLWEFSECSSNNCGGTWQSGGAGWDLTSNAVYVSRYAYNVDVRVTIKTSDYGSVVGASYTSVSGAGETPPSTCADPQQIDCQPAAYSRGTTTPMLMQADGGAAATRTERAKTPSPRSKPVPRAAVRAP